MIGTSVGGTVTLSATTGVVTSVEPAAGSLVACSSSRSADSNLGNFIPDSSVLDDAVVSDGFTSEGAVSVCIKFSPVGVLADGSFDSPPSSSRLFIDASMISTDSLMSRNGGGSLGGGGGGPSEASESRLVLDTEVCS